MERLRLSHAFRFEQGTSRYHCIEHCMSSARCRIMVLRKSSLWAGYRWRADYNQTTLISLRRLRFCALHSSSGCTAASVSEIKNHTEVTAESVSNQSQCCRTGRSKARKAAAK